MVDFASLPIPVVPYVPACRPGTGVTAGSFQNLMERVPRDFLASPHRLGFHEIFLVTEGTGTFSIDLTRFECRPGSLLWIRPNQVLQCAPQDDMQGEVVMFTETFPLPMNDTMGMLDDVLRPSHWRLREPEQVDLEGLLGLLRHEFQSSSQEMHTALLKHLLAVVLLTVMRVCRVRREEQVRQDGFDHDLIELFVRFRQELDRSYRTTRRVEDYAAVLNCTPRALSSASRAVHGNSAKDVIDARVALEARRLLAHTRLPIGVVARQLGFTEVTNFTKFFIRRVNMTPGSFRRTQGMNLQP
ncbi:AraC family transcriptional regulator [Streptomyces fuscichromogenes]|uniref:helix-turn-helix transcriptional regulator n=1 Tax=Streptomyces fuscichromogenes TaxID=1324013 RepID=UPI00382FEFF4